MTSDLLGKCLMIQGVASGVGKSLLATGLCRILAQDGLGVAPFKAWNMTTHSYTTAHGLEIGWSQGIQAEAAGIDATGHMNPFLLKPSTQGKTQILIRGVPCLDETLRDIHKLPPSGPWPIIAESLDILRRQYDVIIMEGAGSPAEINLKDRDVANMGVARLAHAPVILAADIHRGGALAALVGTCDLLDAQENRHIVGFVINKFRGDFDILRPGLAVVEEMTGKPVLGVIPYIPGINLGEEDAVGQEMDNRGASDINGQTVPPAEERAKHLDKLADAIRSSLDIEQIHQIIGSGIGRI
ncbi:MAG: cobyric acid synthase [Firmicutes bacterium]|nr:cobyric acid synthase [Bacillota bacterium]